MSRRTPTRARRHVGQVTQGMVAELVSEYEWGVVGIGADRDFPTFSYTVGLTELNHPELLMLGIDPRIAMTLLNSLGRLVKEGRRLQPEERIEDILSGFEVLIHGPIDPKAGRLFQAIGLYGQIDALQVMWPDPHGRFQGELGYQTKYDQVQPRVALV